jgi:hypothetical protein
MSATAATLNSDYAAIVAARAPIAAALTPAATAVAAGIKTISADLKGTTDRSLKIENARLVAHLRVDQIRLLSALRMDSTILTLRGSALSAQARAAGLAVLQKATTLRMARVTSTANNLNTVVAAALATLLGDTHLAAFNSDLDALTAANASNTQLASDVAGIKAAVTVQPFDTAAQAFATATGTLATDLLPPVTPPVVSVYDLSGDWSDTSNPTSGNVWTYRQGTTTLNRITNWVGNPGQDGWGTTNVVGTYLPFMFKDTTAVLNGTGIQAGDVIVHSTDGANGIGNGLSNILWRDPAGGISGPATITGSLWFAGTDAQSGRTDQYDVLFTHNGITTNLATGAITGGNSSRATPISINLPINVVAGDTVELLVTKTSTLGSFVGTNLTITGG